MGHSHFHAVLIFYAWTAVVSVGCLLFFLVPSGYAVVFLLVGLIVCTILTLAPLSRRKVVEATAQSTELESPEAPLAASLDPLDAASESLSPPAETKGA
jgi:UDP-GlcNAc:undecaprenyl-phosphate GlcNAc-1-phosphate transferase